MYVVDEDDSPQLLAVMESPDADTEGTERDIDFLERETSVKRFISDSIESFGQIEPVEPCTALEELFGQCFNALRDTHGPQHGTACKSLFSEVNECFGQFDSFER